MKRVIILILTILTFVCCEQKQIKTPKNSMCKFEQFIAKEKFIEDESIFYPGIGDPKLKPILTEKINNVAENFESVSRSNNPTENSYQDEIEKGLASFTDVYLLLDTEDRERVCHYFEEIIDIVGLKSSDGKLNKFMYGFDPK